jgi:hypothetical protein
MKTPTTLLLGALLPLVVCGAAKPADDCLEKPEQTFVCDVEDLRPTQLSVGMSEVKSKEAELSKKPAEKLEAYKSTHPEPIVRGPEGALYIIDHHHLARALSDMGVKQTFCYVAGDLSNLSGQDFFDEMTKRNWLFLEDNTGAKKEAGDLPLRVSGLQDDPYRSLAGEVRDAGGFGKTCEPFAEFRWADFFREQIGQDLLTSDHDQALSEAKSAAGSPKACKLKLPGFEGAPCP